jgi:hypothetical protein
VGDTYNKAVEVYEPGMLRVVERPVPEPEAAEFAERVRRNQAKLISDLKPQYDFIVCGSGSSGSVVARRLEAGQHHGALRHSRRACRRNSEKGS